jgi:hypothetical protein
VTTDDITGRDMTAIAERRKEPDQDSGLSTADLASAQTSGTQNSDTEVETRYRSFFDQLLSV